MVRNTAVPETLSDLAAGQWGLFTSAQARRAGLSGYAVVRLAEARYLERVRHGVYRITGTPPGSADRLQAAWLAIRPGLTRGERLAESAVEVVSHRSAAQLHRLGDLDADRLEFTSPDRRQARDPDVRFHRGVVPAIDWTVVDGLPVTTVLRTIADLARVRVDGGHLAGVVRDAVVTVHLDTDQVAQVLRPYAHYYGVPLGDGHALLSDLLQTAGVPRSTLAVAELAITGDQRQAFEAIAQLAQAIRVSPDPAVPRALAKVVARVAPASSRRATSRSQNQIPSPPAAIDMHSRLLDDEQQDAEG